MHARSGAWEMAAPAPPTAAARAVAQLPQHQSRHNAPTRPSSPSRIAGERPGAAPCRAPRPAARSVKRSGGRARYRPRAGI